MTTPCPALPTRLVTCTPHWTAFYDMVEELAARLPKTPAADKQKPLTVHSEGRGVEPTTP